MKQLNKEYYVYRHIRPDKDCPFYIGIGKGRRWRYRTGRNEIWERIVSKNYGVFIPEIMIEKLTLEQAFESERYFIKLYGRVDNNTGTLANMTDGGDGSSGLSDIAKIKISKANTGKKRTEEFKKLRALVRKGKKHTEETKRKMSESQLGAKNHRYGKPASYSVLEKLKHLRGSKNSNYRGAIYAVNLNNDNDIHRFTEASDIKIFLSRPMSDNLAMVYACISGRRKHSYGYKWFREDKGKSELIMSYASKFLYALK